MTRTVLFQIWTLGMFLLGMAYGEYVGCETGGIKHDGSTGPGYAPYADKATP
jgi:hypothetical protein